MSFLINTLNSPVNSHHIEQWKISNQNSTNNYMSVTYPPLYLTLYHTKLDLVIFKIQK